jgi:hypothetical protein
MQNGQRGEFILDCVCAQSMKLVRIGVDAHRE